MLKSKTNPKEANVIPVVALVGRPNVGKSTLFNRLTRNRNALISAYPGTTRDRQYGEVLFENHHFLLIDTGGITEEENEVGKLITQQAKQAIEDATYIFFVIDGRSALIQEDHYIADLLRRSHKPIFLIVNKTEGLDLNVNLADAYELGIKPIFSISAAHGSGIENLLSTFVGSEIQPPPEDEKQNDDQPLAIKLAIVGRPNVGKSTLTNRMLGEERVIVHDSPGTTRDSIFIPLERLDQHYILIDTAGVRKRKKVNEVPEKFSIVKTLQAIESCHVVLYVIDGRIGVSDQDLKLLGFILDCGKGLVIAVNKWDGMQETDRAHAKATLDRQLDFITFARIHFISALHGSGVGNLFASVQEAYASATKKLSTSVLTKLLQQAQLKHTPPLVKGRRIKLRYAHPGGHNPPLIIIHGNQVDALPDSYKRFLSHFYQEKLKLFGTPVFIQFKSSDNPFS